MAKKDERLKLISEALNGIKVYRYHKLCQSLFSVEAIMYVHLVLFDLC